MAWLVALALAVRIPFFWWFEPQNWEYQGLNVVLVVAFAARLAGGRPARGRVPAAAGRALLVVLTLALLTVAGPPLWRLRGLRPLTALPTDAARRHLRAATQSRWLPVRLLMYGPLGLFMSSYFDQAYVHRALDYEPAPFVASRIALRRAWVDGAEPGMNDEIHHLPWVPQ